MIRDRGTGKGSEHYIQPFFASTYKNSSGDEIANVNFYAVLPGNYPNSLK